jgi:hypothetical protein
MTTRSRIHTTFDRPMIRAMLMSPTFKRAIREQLPSTVDRPVDLLSESEWDELHDTCSDLFLEVAPEVCTGTIGRGIAGSSNEDPPPMVIGCDGVFCIWDSGFGLSEEWFKDQDEAIASADATWPAFRFVPRKRRQSKKRS